MIDIKPGDFVEAIHSCPCAPEPFAIKRGQRFLCTDVFGTDPCHCGHPGGCPGVGLIVSPAAAPPGFGRCAGMFRKLYPDLKADDLTAESYDEFLSSVPLIVREQELETSS